MPRVRAAALKPHLANAGYASSLIIPGIRLSHGETVPLVAFAHPPADARSACIAVIEAEASSPELVARFGSTGAPVVLVCGQRGVEWWKQSAAEPVQIGPPIPPSEVGRFFSGRADDFAPDAVYRAKTWGRFDSQHQRSFVDLGLMPVVEERIGRDLERLIVSNVQRLRSLLQWRTLSDKQGQWLLKSVFWLVSAKILRDKEVPRFVDIELRDVDSVFRAVAEHYSAHQLAIPNDRQRRALAEVAVEVGRFSSLQLTTTESLAYVYENALISKETRQSLGTHSTPTYLVDYVVGRLAHWVSQIPADERDVFEPACGHAGFLVSAMRLLAEFLPAAQSTPARRRQYLRTRIHGCDVDAFALEIARLSLTLADIPNPNGWDLAPGDFFLKDELADPADRATIFLANPPFENFSTAEREWYRSRGASLTYRNKAAELLARVLPRLRDGSVFGVVVPQGFLNSKGSAAIRQQLLDGFEFNEICLFPDKVFAFSDSESAVLIGRKRRPGPSSRLRYRRVRERDMDRFRKDYRTTIDQSVTQSALSDSSLRIPDLGDLWDSCSALPRLEESALIGQGFTFKGEPLRRGRPTVSDRRFPGAVRGFHRFPRGIGLHELPPEVWLNTQRDVVRRPHHGTEVGIPQIVLNEAPSSRGPWRLKALIDRDGHAVTGRFNVLRPSDDSLPLELFWAICNSPVANAFVFSHAGKRHNDAGLLRSLPMPSVDLRSVGALIKAATRYLDFVIQEPAVASEQWRESARLLMLHVDNEVLKLYSLERELERQLLLLFSNWQRDGVPFKFTQYYPENVEGTVRLGDYLMVTAGWADANRRRGELIRRKVGGEINSKDREELEQLQDLAELRRRIEAPLPITAMESEFAAVQRKGE